MILSLVLLIAVFSAASANPNAFEAVRPGGDTVCAKGGEYVFHYRKGTVNKLVIEFEGGGACWDGASCALPIYTTTATTTASASGIRSQSDRNALKEYHHLFIPYCSADAFSGNSTQKYKTGTVHHYGRVNAMAAMDFIQKTVPSPSSVVTTGCSAGSLGAIVWLPFILGRAYPDAAQHASWHDSYVGVLAQGQYDGGRANWPLDLFDEIVPALAPGALDPWTPDIGTRIVRAIVEAFPKSTASLFTHNADAVQTSFYVLGGGRDSFTTLMRAELDELHAQPNVKYWIGSGVGHCIGQGAGYFAEKAEDGSGATLADWVGEIAQHDAAAAARVDCCGSGGGVVEAEVDAVTALVLDTLADEQGEPRYL